MSDVGEVGFREPTLFPRLRFALSNLYGLGTSNLNLHLDSHSYLIEFQTRNIRRKAIALQQSKVDKNDVISSHLLPRDEEFVGSSFYACLCLLFTAQVHDTERLFAAQSILHRMRRMKLAEAIDLECEYHHEENSVMSVETVMYMTSRSTFPSQEHLLYWPQFLRFHGQTVAMLHQILLGEAIKRYFHQWSGDLESSLRFNSASDIEERIKGEIAIYALASAAYLNGYLDVIQESSGLTSKRGPLLHTLTAAMAVIAMRLRYTPSDPSNPAIDLPIVSMIVKSFQVVFEISSSFSIETLLPSDVLKMTDNMTLNVMLQHNSLIHTRSLIKCVCIALASIPDALFGSEGGARGRISIDPKCIQATNSELIVFETGVGLLQKSIMHLHAIQVEGDSNVSGEQYMKERILCACERWAKFVPLTHDFVQTIITTTQSNLSKPTQDVKSDFLTSYDKIFFAFLTRIFEGACLTSEEIVAISAGLTFDSNSHQTGRKRQSSKSKKRHKQKILEVIEGEGDRVAEIRREEIAKEMKLRGSIASLASATCWNEIYPLYRFSLDMMDSSPQLTVEGEGPIGSICACVSACIIHYLKFGAPKSDQSMALVDYIFNALKEICSSPNSSVRALSFEQIVAVHKALIHDQTQNLGMSMKVTDYLCECSLILSERCAYPNDYFDHMEWDNSEELEIERNDVRDTVRAICSFDDGVESFPHSSLICLEKTISHCHKGITAIRPSILPRETLVHVLSSPAKSIHNIAIGIVSREFKDKVMGENIIRMALDSLFHTCSCLCNAYLDSTPLKQTLPINRLVSIMIASFSPILATITENLNCFSSEIQVQLERTIGIGLQIICESLFHSPELIASSTLGDSPYDIRGTMRSPGGEDHCSCIALMRLVRESDILAECMISLAANYLKKGKVEVLMELANVYSYLYNCEHERPRGIFHGKGVTPKSRRVFLNGMTKLGLSTINSDPELFESISIIFSSIFEKSIDRIIFHNSLTGTSFADKCHQVCESCYDLAAFESIFCKQIFMSHNKPSWKCAIDIVMEMLLQGYKYPVTGHLYDDGLNQWVRLRASFLTLLRSCADPGLSPLAIEVTKHLIKTECTVIIRHFSQLLGSESSIFNEPNICEDVLSGGAFIIVLRDILSKISSCEIKNDNIEENISALDGCMSIMGSCKESIYAVINLRGPSNDIGWEDPRMPTAEAWFLSLSELISAYNTLRLDPDARIYSLVSETICVVINLLLYKRTEKEVESTSSLESMSLDGPVTLALIEFFHDAIILGREVFAHVAVPFLDVFSCVNFQTYNDHRIFGGSIIAAALYRGSSGALPPWFIEYLPFFFESLFDACSNIESFMSVLQVGAELSAVSNIGFVPAGSKLAGYYFNCTKASAKEEFFHKASELVSSGDSNKWRRMKVLVKAICGGKKKATDFNLKPQPSSWECDRI